MNTPRNSPSASSALAPGSAPASTPDPDVLVVENLALADAVARRFSRRGGRDDDLLQVARIGLLKAARRFDPDRGVDFAAFAVPTISGEIKRHLRDYGWFIRPPRRLQELRVWVVEASGRLTHVLGRRPSLVEIADDVGESPALVQEAIECQRHLRPDSLDMPVGGDRDATLGELLPIPGDDMERAERMLALWAALRCLPARERGIMYRRFFEDRTQQEIADEFGISQMQVSRLLTKCLSELRDYISHPFASPTARVD